MSTNYHPTLVVGLRKSEIKRKDIDDLIENDTLNIFKRYEGDPDPVVGFVLYTGTRIIEQNGLILFNIEKHKEQFHKITQQEANLILCTDFH